MPKSYDPRLYRVDEQVTAVQRFEDSNTAWDRLHRPDGNKRDYVEGLKDVPCMDCGGKFPTVCMDFDHVRGVKKFTIAVGLYKVDWPTLLLEIEKCEVVCSNCHRIRTKKRIRV